MLASTDSKLTWYEREREREKLEQNKREELNLSPQFDSLIENLTQIHSFRIF